MITPINSFKCNQSDTDLNLNFGNSVLEKLTLGYFDDAPKTGLLASCGLLTKCGLPAVLLCCHGVMDYVCLFVCLFACWNT